MTPAALVADLQARGVTLEPRGDKLVVRPADRLTPEDVDRLRACKPELLRLLAAAPVPVAAGPALEPARWRSVALDPRTVAEALGPEPDAHAVACVRFDVLAAVRALAAEVQAGTIRPGLRLVRGRPLGDWLDLGEVARLLASWDRATRPGRPA